MIRSCIPTGTFGQQCDRPSDGLSTIPPCGDQYRWSVPAAVGLAAALCLGLAQVLAWLVGIRGVGGLEAYVLAHTDFLSALTGGLAIRSGDGARLYDLASQHAIQSRVVAPYFALRADTTLPYIHPPLEAILIAPLMGLPYSLIYALWVVLAVCAVLLSLRLLTQALPMARPVRWVLSAASLSYLPFHEALWLGQSTPLVLLGLCGAYVALKRGRDGWAGVALTLVALKPQFLPAIVLLLLLARRGKSLAILTGLLAASSAAYMPLLGLDWPLHYARGVADSARGGARLGEYPAVMHNWRALLLQLLGGWAPRLVTPALIGVTALSLGVLVWCWWRWHSTAGRVRVARPAAEPLPDLLWALAVVVAVLISPHLYIHDLTVLILPVWIIASRATGGTWSPRLSRAWLAVLWLVYGVPLLSLWPAAPSATVVVPSVLCLVLTGALLVAAHAREPQSPPAPLAA